MQKCVNSDDLGNRLFVGDSPSFDSPTLYRCMVGAL